MKGLFSFVWFGTVIVLLLGVGVPTSAWVVSRTTTTRTHSNTLFLGTAYEKSKASLISSSSSSSCLNATPSRRDFLQETGTVVTGVSAAALGMPSSSCAIGTDSSIHISSSTIPKSTSLNLPPMGLGAWAWGDPIFWGYNPKNDDELGRVFDYAVTHSKGKTTLFDTAELYGFGRSESLLGDFTKKYSNNNNDDDDDSTQVLIASKFAALPFRTDATSVIKACEASVKRLGGRPIDLYQIHFPNAWSNAEYWDGLATVYEKGLVKNVGVSNYGSDALRACHKALADRGIPLATNQIQYSLLYPWPERNGLLNTCKELNVKVLAYSPLALGYLTGKYDSPTNLPDGPRKSIGQKLFSTPDFANLLDTMKQIASSHSSSSSSSTSSPATLSQVAVNWTRAKGTIPIPGARTISQVEQNYGALEWNLSPAEVQQLDDAARQVTTFLTPDQNPFPKQDINTKLIMYDS